MHPTNGLHQHPMLKRLTIYGTLVLALIAFLVADERRQRLHREFAAEHMAFMDLCQLARQMISERADGVSEHDGSAYIESYDALYNYVAAKGLTAVGDRAASNPFPRLLPGPRYARASSKVKGPEDLLVWSEVVHHRPIGDQQYRMTASGRMK